MASYSDLSFQSTLPARGATPGFRELASPRCPFQSTLPARGATPSKRVDVADVPFQSTLPARGATCKGFGLRSPVEDFNPRSPHGERRNPARHKRCAGHFNPRSPHGERRNSGTATCGNGNFNPRSPHGERRQRRDAARSTKGISIHAPRTGSDELRKQVRGNVDYFNPRSPHGERLYALSK